MNDTLPPLPEPFTEDEYGKRAFTADQMREYAAAALAAAVDDKPRAWIDRWGNYAHPTLKDTAGATPLYERPAAAAAAEPVALKLKRYAHYCSWDGGGTAVPEEEADGEWVRFDDAQALLKAVAEPVATGFKLVPLEPTPEMAKAGCYRYCAAFVKDYKAMIAAAPAAPPQREPYDQTALGLCNACGWKAVGPDGCLNCAPQREREPLTDEQIDEACLTEPGALYAIAHSDQITAFQFREQMRKVARAIERAHGIAPASAPKGTT